MTKKKAAKSRAWKADRPPAKRKRVDGPPRPEPPQPPPADIPPLEHPIAEAPDHLRRREEAFKRRHGITR